MCLCVYWGLKGGRVDFGYVCMSMFLSLKINLNSDDRDFARYFQVSMWNLSALWLAKANQCERRLKGRCKRAIK